MSRRYLRRALAVAWLLAVFVAGVAFLGRGFVLGVVACGALVGAMWAINVLVDNA